MLRDAATRRMPVSDALAETAPERHREARTALLEFWRGATDNAPEWQRDMDWTAINRMTADEQRHLLVALADHLDGIVPHYLTPPPKAEEP